MPRLKKGKLYTKVYEHKLREFSTLYLLHHESRASIMSTLNIGKTTYYKILNDVLDNVKIPDSKHTAYTTTLDRLYMSYRNAVAMVTNPSAPEAIRLRAIKTSARLAKDIMETRLKEAKLYQQWLQHEKYFNKVMVV